MNAMLDTDTHGQLLEPTTLTLQRVLPGPIERVWSYLVDGDLRRQWLASGDMVLQAGAPFELVWRNDELSSTPGRRPAGFGDEERMHSRIVAVEAPHRLVFTWDEAGEVDLTLETQGDKVLLTVVHRRLATRADRLSVAAGWHAHLGILRARLEGHAPAPFWDAWTRLHAEYDARLAD